SIGDPFLAITGQQRERIANAMPWVMRSSGLIQRFTNEGAKGRRRMRRRTNGQSQVPKGVRDMYRKRLRQALSSFASAFASSCLRGSHRNQIYPIKSEET